MKSYVSGKGLRIPSFVFRLAYQKRTALYIIFRRLNGDNKGMKIDGECLTNPRFADDIFLFSETYTPRSTTDATRTIR